MMALIAQQLFALSTQEFFRQSLEPRVAIDGIPSFVIRATMLNLRHTFHAYYCEVLDIGTPFIIVVQAYVEGFYSRDTGVVFRDPDCYLACMHDQSELARDLETSLSSYRPPSLASHNAVVALQSGSQFHIAHYLWNHLSALWRALVILRQRNCSEITIRIFSGSEFYGSLPQLFSSFDFLNYRFMPRCGVLVGEPPSWEGLILFEPYENGYIPQSLADSIQRLANESFPCAADLPGPHIVYSPRLANRRPANRGEIISELIRFVNQKCQPARWQLTIDVFSLMHGQDASHVNGVDDYRKLGESLKSLVVAESPDVAVTVLADASILQTISVLSSSHFGVYEWGANLSWYSWILRKPVLCLTPPSVIEMLKATQNKLIPWGSYFWESDSPVPLIPATSAIDMPPEEMADHTYRVSPEDYLVDGIEYATCLESAWSRLCRRDL